MPARRRAFECGTSIGLGAEGWRACVRSARDRRVGCPVRSSGPQAELTVVGPKTERKLQSALPPKLSCVGRLCVWVSGFRLFTHR